MDLDPFTQDPVFDETYPADQSSFSTDSDGSLINGLIEIAQGKEPHACIIMLHGFPGNEKNIDLAQFFRRAGFCVVLFSYRGCWGSKGTYSYKHCMEDTLAIVSYVKSNAQSYRIDPNNITLFGHSLGAFIALYSAFKSPEITRVISISGWFLHLMTKAIEIDSTHKKVIYVDVIDSSMNPLEGTSPEMLKEEIKNIDSWGFKDFYSTLATKKLCFVAGLKDNIVPVEHYEYPLIKEIEKFKPGNLTRKVFDNATHSYSDHRIRLAKFLLDWLLTQN